MNTKNKINIALFVIVVLLVIFLTETNKQSIINQLNTWKLLPQPEKFTELYFNNSLTLPSYVPQKHPIAFSFTVHNLEYKPYTYPYTVYLANSAKKIAIKKGQFSLNQDQYKTINDTFTLTVPIKRAQIVVNLPNKKQNIFFWITSTPPQNTPIPKPTAYKTIVAKVQPLTKHYGAWYWQPLLNKALIWLGYKFGHDIWGTGFPVFPTPTPNTSTSSNSNSSPTPTITPKPNTPVAQTVVPTQVVTPQANQTPTVTIQPTNTQNN